MHRLKGVVCAGAPSQPTKQPARDGSGYQRPVLPAKPERGPQVREACPAEGTGGAPDVTAHVQSRPESSHARAAIAQCRCQARIVGAHGMRVPAAAGPAI
jgi:hypothetical protein